MALVRLQEQGGERRYGGRLPEERRAERRRRLLAAGLELFGTVGYLATSIGRLCAQAGVTARHFYEEFGTREALLVAVYDETVAGGTAVIAEALAGAPRDRVYRRTEAAVGAFVHYALDDPRRGRVLTMEVVGISPELERHRREVVHHFARLIQEESDRLATMGLVVRRDYTLSSLILAGGINELIVDWLTGARERDLPAVIAELARLFVVAGQGVDPAPASRGARGRGTGA